MEVGLMDLRWVDGSGVTDRPLDQLSELRLRDDGFLWLDIPTWSADAEQVLAEEFGFHSMAIAAARERNHTPRIHVYSDHVFIVIQAPEIGQRGHVHYLELDQFIGNGSSSPCTVRSTQWCPST
jgi:magnesium transporter